MSQRVTITRVRLEPKAKNERHQHDTSEQIWVELSGRGELLLAGDNTLPFEAGDVVRFAEGDVNTWVEEKSIEKAREQSHRQIWRMNVAETDKNLRAHICSRGFQEVPNYAMLSLECTLDREIPQSQVPEGYTVRQAKEVDAFNRAAAQHAAFIVDKPFQEYFQQYQHFMASPGYSRGFELVVVDPNQSVASFCIVWPDIVSRIGQVDPVGTHPDFQQKGLGKVVLGTGLKYLQSVGMHLARICVEADNTTAIKLYERFGFHTANQLLTYQKQL